MTQVPLLAANWKMNLGPVAAERYLGKFLLMDPVGNSAEVVFFPPAVSLARVAQVLSGTALTCGSQDIHWEPSGAFTGATSVPLAKEAGATSTLVGHSERRHIFGESDSETALKVRAALAGELAPILCVGEKLAERDAGITEEIVTRQLDAVFDSGNSSQLSSVTIAYEPVWAIGTGRTASPGDAAQVHGVIREHLSREYRWKGRILYGGSVTEDNAASLLGEEQIDGLLVGGASLDPERWHRLITSCH